MSVARQKLIEETREWLKKGNVILPKELVGESEEDLLLRVAEMRSLEKKANEEIKRKKEEQRKYLLSVMEIFRKAATDEDSDAAKYKQWASQFAAIPTAQNVLNNIAFEEEKHAKYLRDLIRNIYLEPYRREKLEDEIRKRNL